MYINLYPNDQLDKTKQFLLWLGLFLLVGGSYAFLQELTNSKPLWVGRTFGAMLLVGIGSIGIGIGLGKVHLKDAFFSMNADRISFRLTLYGSQQVLPWREIRSIHISDSTIAFELQTTQVIELSMGYIHDLAMARHIAASLRLAALDKNIRVNGVKMQQQYVHSMRA